MVTNIFNTDTIEHFASVAFQTSWDEMLTEARRFVEIDCEWHNEDDKENVFEDLIDQVNRFTNP